MTEEDMIQQQTGDLKRARELAPEVLRRLKKAAEAAKTAVPKPRE